eukprot:3191158-Rhodomonas_salina.2
MAKQDVDNELLTRQHRQRHGAEERVWRLCGSAGCQERFDNIRASRADRNADRRPVPVGVVEVLEFLEHRYQGCREGKPRKSLALPLLPRERNQRLHSRRVTAQDCLQGPEVQVDTETHGLEPPRDDAQHSLVLALDRHFDGFFLEQVELIEVALQTAKRLHGSICSTQMERGLSKHVE